MYNTLPQHTGKGFDILYSPVFLCVFLQIYTRYGKCYTFNSGLDGNPLLTTLKGGTGNGLEVMLDIQQDEYLPVWGETGQCSFKDLSNSWMGISYLVELSWKQQYTQ